MIPTLTILHILAMFIAFAFTTGVGIVMGAVAASGSVPAIRAATGLGIRFQVVGITILIVGVAFGMWLTAAAGYGFGARWISIAFVLFLGLLVTGFGFHQPWTRRLAAAAAASPDDAPSADLRAVATDASNRIVGPISGLLWIGLIVDMVVKP